MTTHSELDKTSILILDDDVLQARALSRKLQKTGYSLTAVTHTGIQAIQSVRRQIPDIALLDIRLSGQDIDGIDVGKKLQQFNKNIIIIYITAYANDENFRKALDSNPYAFIEKPYQMKRLNWEIELAIRRLVKEKKADSIVENTTIANKKSAKLSILCFSNFILIKKGGGSHELVNLDDILYLKANNVYTDIFTNNGKRYCVTMVLKRFEVKFKEQAILEKNYKNFLRIHNSYIVNTKHITNVNVKKNGGKLSLSNHETIAVSRTYVDDFWANI